MVSFLREDASAGERLTKAYLSGDLCSFTISLAHQPKLEILVAILLELAPQYYAYERTDWYRGESVNRLHHDLALVYVQTFNSDILILSSGHQI